MVITLTRPTTDSVNGERGKNLIFVVDYEENITNPALDLTWFIYRRLVSSDTKKRFPEGLIQTFDEYDDVRWEWERKEKGHSTGTTPLISDFIAAYDGIDDEKLVEFVRPLIQENPGVDSLIKFLMDNGTIPYFVTNSYSAMSLITAYKYGIPSSRVFAHGRQLTQDRLDYFDSKQTFEETVLEETKERSPIGDLFTGENAGPYRMSLGNFLDNYLQKCEEMLLAYKAKDIEKIKRLKAEHDMIFDEIRYFEVQHRIKDMLLYENGVTGGHNKVKVIKNLFLPYSSGRNVVYLGNSIVDADPIAFAQYGFAVNCTNKHALHDAKLNLVVPDFSLLIQIFEDILNGRFDFAKAKKYEKNGMRIFLPDEIRERFDYVKSVNEKVKSALKDLYKY